METRTCSKCEGTKAADCFAVTAKGNRAKVCWDCDINRNPEARRAYNNQWMHRRYWKNPEAARAKNNARNAANPEAHRRRVKESKNRHIDEVLARKRAYYHAHADSIKAANRQWKANNPDKVRNGKRRYRAEKPEARQSESRRYYEKHGEDVRQRSAQYKKTEAGKETVRRGHHKRKAAKLGVATEEIRPLSQMVAEQGGKCYLCGRRFTKADPAVIEHYQPLAKGGSHTNANTLAAHKSCNGHKLAATPAEYAKRIGKLMI